MLITDIVLLLSLAGFCFAWLWTRLPRRTVVLWATAIAGAAFGVSGVIRGRWQAGLGAAVAVVFLAALAMRSHRSEAPGHQVPMAPGITFVILTGLSFGLLYSLPVFALPEPDGPHEVGVRDFELTDTTRLGVLYASPEEPRRLAIRVWYPAADADGLEPQPYASEAELETTLPAIATQDLGMPAFFYSHLRHVDTNSYANAPILDEGPLPVVFFHHGLNGHLSQNTVLMEHLASHGYIVFSVSHPYDSAPLVFDDGEVIALPDVEVAARAGDVEYSDAALALVERLGLRENGQTYDERFDGMLAFIELARVVDDRVYDTSPRVWVEDALFVEQALAHGRAPIGDILAAADLSKVGQVGMSFGGSTAAALGYLDPRSAAVVSLDGSDDHHVGYDTDVPVPLLMLYTDSINTLGTVGTAPFGWNDFLYERFETTGTREDVVRLHLGDVQHFGVTDSQLFSRGPLHAMLNGPLESGRTLDAINDIVCGFFDEHLRGEPAGFPEAQLSDHPVERHDVAPIREWWISKTPDERADTQRALDEALEDGAPVHTQTVAT